MCLNTFCITVGAAIVSHGSGDTRLTHLSGSPSHPSNAKKNGDKWNSWQINASTNMVSSPNSSLVKPAHLNRNGRDPLLWFVGELHCIDSDAASQHQTPKHDERGLICTKWHITGPENSQQNSKMSVKQNLTTKGKYGWIEKEIVTWKNKRFRGTSRKLNHHSGWGCVTSQKQTHWLDTLVSHKSKQ